MDDKANPKFIEIFAPLVFAVTLLLFSSIGVFDGILSFSDHLQSAYRSDIKTQIDGVEDAVSVVTNISDIKEQRDDYEGENIRLREEITTLKSQIGEEEVINSQCTVGTFSDDYSLIPVRIIRFRYELPGSFVVNKGARDEVEVGDILVYREYAIGEVINVYDYNSEVRTLLSSKTSIPVISEHGTKGILESTKGTDIEVRKVLADADVNIGEDIFTLGINSNYPANLYLGEVIDIFSTAAETSKTLRLKTEIDYDELREVFILKVASSE